MTPQSLSEREEVWMRVAMVIAILVVSITCVPSLPVHAKDWLECAHYLQQVQRTANAMQDWVQTLASREEGVQSCVKYPEIYDVSRDGCTSLRGEHETALQAYKNALDELNNRLRAVQNACGAELSFGSAPRAASSRGEQRLTMIRQAQQRLQAAGFDPGPADGQLGPRTVKALRNYQVKRKLAVTGQLDDPTRKALGLE
jgi:Putative peptidoglycan binding domain